MEFKIQNSIYSCCNSRPTSHTMKTLPLENMMIYQRDLFNFALYIWWRIFFWGPMSSSSPHSPSATTSNLQKQLISFLCVMSMFLMSQFVSWFLWKLLQLPNLWKLESFTKLVRNSCNFVAIFFRSRNAELPKREKCAIFCCTIKVPGFKPPTHTTWQDWIKCKL